MTLRLTLLLALLLPLAAVAAPPAAPVEGVDYHRIENGTPLAPLAGKIEVVEIFGYWCHHCADFAPKIEAWKARQPKDVRVTYLALPNATDDPLARAFFASQAAGTLARTHEATFVAIHTDHSLPKNPTADELAAFYGQRGADAAKIRALMASPEIIAKLRPAYEFAVRSGLEGTPTLVVNGKYRIDGGTHDDRLRIAGQLIARERAAAKSSR